MQVPKLLIEKGVGIQDLEGYSRLAARSENGVVTSARNAAMPPKWLVGRLWNARMELKLISALKIKLVASFNYQ